MESLDDISGTEAKFLAQRIAFAPFSFYAAVVMRDSGLLEAVSESGSEGKELSTLARDVELSEYGISILLDFGRNLGLVEESDGAYTLGPVGFFVLNDEMTRVNMNFTRDMGYDALPHLAESLEEGRPVGLETLGSWDVLYEGLRELPEPARTSWHNFDHFYSERSFDELLPIVFEEPVDQILDVGGNIGLWTVEFLEYDPDVEVTLLDLPSMMDDAKENVREAGVADRVTFHGRDLRESPIQFPDGMDVIWMCQLLDCFPPDKIVEILRAAESVMDADTRLLIVELFPDRQEFEAGTFCLNAISLYFTCIANGESRMYPYEQFKEYVREAGLRIADIHDVPAGEHTLLCCRTSD